MSDGTSEPEGETWVEFKNGSRIKLSGRARHTEFRGAEEHDGKLRELRGPRSAECEMWMIMDPEPERCFLTPFDEDPREPDGSVVLGG